MPVCAFWNTELSRSGSLKKRLLSGGASAAASKLVVALGGLALNTLLTRLLPPEQVGAYFLLVSVVTIGALFVLLGIHQAIVPLIARTLEKSGPAGARRLLRTAYVCFFLAAAVVGVLYWLVGGEWLGMHVFHSPLVASFSGFTAGWLVLRGLQTLGSQALRGFHRIGLASVFEGALSSVLIVMLLGGLLLWGRAADLSTVLMITLAVLMVTTLANILVLGRVSRGGQESGFDFKRLLGAGMPLFVVSIAMPGLTEAHIWVLGHSVPEAQVAIYGAAYRVARIVVIPLLIINSVIPPMIAQLLEQGRKDKAEQVLRATAAVAGVASVAVVVVFVLGGETLLGLLFGDYYAGGAEVLLILVGAQAINALTGSPGVLLIASGRQKVVMRFGLISGIGGILTSIVLVGSLGAEGVAYGLGGSLVAHNLLMWNYCRARMGIRTHMGILKDVRGGNFHE